MQQTFTRERLERIAQLERWHFWFAGRRALVEALLGRYVPTGSLVLDIGCGTGATLEILARAGARPVGLDLRPEGLRAWRASNPRAPLVQAEATRLPFAANVFHALTALDVLEHVDDRAMLDEARRVLRDQGLLLLSVPAVPWLWSYRDEAAGHLRRYTRQSLSAVLTTAGLRLEELHYYQFALFPAVVASRLLGRSGPRARDMEERPFPFLNRVLARLNESEARLSFKVRWPWGSSLIAVCRKL